MLKIILLLFAFSQLLYSQITQQWIKTYPTVSYGAFVNMADDSGNVYSAGASIDNNTDFLLIKYDSNGNQKWLRTYNGPANRIDFIKCITKDKNGFIYVSGESEKLNGDEEYCTQKYNAAGTLLWTTRFNSFYDFENKPVAIGLDGSGNVFVTGKSSVLGQHPRRYQFVTVKYNPSGNMLWTQYFGELPSNDEPVAMAVDSAGNSVITGRCNCSGYLFGIMTVKYNPDGIVLWEVENPPVGFSGREPYCLKIDNSKNIYITGIVEDSLSSYYYRFLTIKYNPSGVKQWEKVYRSVNNTSVFPSTLLIDKNNNLYITGTEHASTLNAVAVKYDAAGNMLWDNIYNTGGNENVTGAAFDTSGNVIITGDISTSSSAKDVFLVSYNPLRTQLYSYRYQTQGNDFARSVSIDKFNNLFIAGFDSAEVYNFITIKFKIDGNVGINNTGNEIPDKYLLSQNYPNPFNPRTIIDYQLPFDNHVVISVFDLTGREVKELINEKHSAGYYKVEWDAANYSSGVYFYRLTAGNFTDIKKMILIK